MLIDYQEIVLSLFGAAYAAPNKGKIIFIPFLIPLSGLSDAENSKIQALFKALHWFSNTFQFKNAIYFKIFSRKPSTLLSNTSLVCVNIHIPSVATNITPSLLSVSVSSLSRVIASPSIGDFSPVPITLNDIGWPAMYDWEEEYNTLVSPDILVAVLFSLLTLYPSVLLDHSTIDR